MLDYVKMINVVSFNARVFWINLAREMSKVEEKSPTKPRKGENQRKIQRHTCENLRRILS